MLPMPILGGTYCWVTPILVCCFYQLVNLAAKVLQGTIVASISVWFVLNNAEPFSEYLNCLSCHRILHS